MLVYTEHKSARFEYVAKLILNSLLGIQTEFTTDFERIAGYEGALLVYSHKHHAKGFQVIPSGLLFEKEVHELKPKFSSGKEIPSLFPVEGGDLHFDIFSASFYMVSRYEEYLPFNPDQHGRFPAHSSLAFRLRFLKKPVVHIWAHELAKALRIRYPQLKIIHPEYRLQPTIDIDNAWAFLNKSFFRTLAGSVKQLFSHPAILKDRLKILSGKMADPFDSFDYIRKIHGEDLILFILANGNSHYDMKISNKNKNWKKLVADLSKSYQIGVHPSYHSDVWTEFIVKEKAVLEEITGKEITVSRQHFLKLGFPETYRNLIDAGIKEDYSMGFAGHTGFRAGISVPYRFFDLFSNRESDLLIHPFCCMDRTLKDYMKLDVEEATEEVRSLKMILQKYGGTFIPVWHNDSLGESREWHGWRKVYGAALE